MYAFTTAAVHEEESVKGKPFGRFSALLALPLYAFRGGEGPKVYVFNRRAIGYGNMSSSYYYKHNLSTRVMQKVVSAIPKEFHLELFQTALFRRPSWENADFDSDSKTLRGRHIITVVSVNVPNPWGRVSAVFNYADFIAKKEVSVRFN